eukprot:scaffold96295_cov36-Phaeocystis_antarctica.AAC.3
MAQTARRKSSTAPTETPVRAREGRQPTATTPRWPYLHLPALCATHATHAAALHVPKPTRSPRPAASGQELWLSPQPRALV